MKIISMIFALFIGTSITFGSLILNIDTESEEIFFRGDEYVNPDGPYQDGYKVYSWHTRDFADYTYILWLNSNVLLPAEALPTLPPTPAPPPFPEPGTIDPISCTMALSPDGKIDFGFGHLYDGFNDFFFQGTEARSSYAHAPTDIKNALQNYSSGNLAPSFANGTPMSVNVIPEPSSIILLAISGVVIKLTRSRMQR